MLEESSTRGCPSTRGRRAIGIDRRRQKMPLQPILLLLAIARASACASWCNAYTCSMSACMDCASPGPADTCFNLAANRITCQQAPVPTCASIGFSTAAIEGPMSELCGPGEVLIPGNVCGPGGGCPSGATKGGSCQFGTETMCLCCTLAPEAAPPPVPPPPPSPGCGSVCSTLSQPWYAARPSHRHSGALGGPSRPHAAPRAARPQASKVRVDDLRELPRMSPSGPARSSWHPSMRAILHLALQAVVAKVQLAKVHRLHGLLSPARVFPQRDVLLPGRGVGRHGLRHAATWLSWPHRSHLSTTYQPPINHL